MNNRIKPLTLEETKLKEEMKERCLTKGQYTDEKAKDKFNMLCHLEDFEVQYYSLLEENNQLKEQRQELRSWLEEETKKGGSSIDLAIRINAIQEVLNKLNELEGSKNE